MSDKKNIYVFCNQKGGVGKTTTVINLGTCLASKGYKTLIVDIDPQGNATSGFGLDKNEVQKTCYESFIEGTPLSEVIIKDVIKNLDIVPANSHLAGVEIELIQFDQREFYLKNMMAPLSVQYDFILIDCPPSLGLLTINALTCADRLMIPLQCEYYALEGLGQLINTSTLITERLNPEFDVYGVIMTMADFRTNLTQQVISEVKSFFKEKVFNTIIPRSVKLSEAPGFGKPAVLYAPFAKGVLHYQELCKEWLERIKKENEHKG